MTSDGHWDPVAFSLKDLKPKVVFILVDDEKRKIWIWIGRDATVKTRFISSTAATEIRRLYGFTFRVQTIDQGEESHEFSECIESIPRKGLVPELAEGQKEKKATKNTRSSSTAKKSTPITKAGKSTVKKASTTKTTHKTPVRKTTTRKTATKTTRKTTRAKPPKTTPKPKSHSSKESRSLNSYLPQDTSIITTPPCPECGVGNLLPYSEKITQEGREDLILPFAKWACSKCEYSPTHQ